MFTIAQSDRSSIIGTALLVFVVIVAVIVVVLLAYAPGYIAAKREHPSRDAIRLCGLLGLFFTPLWLVALIWAYTAPRPKRSAQDRLDGDADMGRFYVQQARARAAATNEPDVDELGEFPGRFEIRGVDRETQLDSRIVVEADSPANARAKAELRGLVVTRVTRCRES